MSDVKLSNSEINTFRSCERKWWFNYYLGKAPSDSNPALVLGTAFHDLMETLYTDGEEAMKAHLSRMIFDVSGTFDIELLTTMAVRYLDWLEETAADQGYDIKHCEVVGETPLIPGATLRGKLDILGHDTELGEWFLLDFKTLANYDLVERLLFFGQMLTYTILCNEDPRLPEVSTAIIRMALKAKGATGGAPKFLDQPVYITESKLRNHRRELERTAQDILDFRAYLDGTDDPVVVGTEQWQCPKCPYAAVCASYGDDLSDWRYMLESEFVDIDPNARYNT